MVFSRKDFRTCQATKWRPPPNPGNGRTGGYRLLLSSIAGIPHSVRSHPRRYRRLFSSNRSEPYVSLDEPPAIRSFSCRKNVERHRPLFLSCRSFRPSHASAPGRFPSYPSPPIGRTGTNPPLRSMEIDALERLIKI